MEHTIKKRLKLFLPLITQFSYLICPIKDYYIFKDFEKGTTFKVVIILKVGNCEIFHLHLECLYSNLCNFIYL
jgi:hypothetical protein